MVKQGSRGGSRMGAGRPKGSGRYKEPSCPVRIPIGLLPEIHDRLEQYQGGMRLRGIPLYSDKVAAGMPSPADEEIESTLDLNEYCIQNPASSFLVRASGESMLDAGISPGDLLVVDRSIRATHGKIVIAAINGELTVKRLHCEERCVQLLPANPNYTPLSITEDMHFTIWGVVTRVIHTL